MFVSEKLDDTLLDLEFTSNECNDTIIDLIEHEIDKFKLERLSAWVANHENENFELEKKIKDLEAIKEKLKEPVRKNSSRRIKVTVK